MSGLLYVSADTFSETGRPERPATINIFLGKPLLLHGTSERKVGYLNAEHEKGTLFFEDVVHTVLFIGSTSLSCMNGHRATPYFTVGARLVTKVRQLEGATPEHMNL